MKKYEAEFEVVTLYTVPIYAESMEDAAERAEGVPLAQIEERARCNE